MRKILNISLLVGGLAVPSALAAQDSDRLQPDFTFKRVGVPSSGAGNRINVQVSSQSSRLPQIESDTAAAPAPPQAAVLDWFWNDVSPDISATGPGRLAQALSVMSNAPAGDAVPKPRLQSLYDIAQQHGTDILVQTVGTNVSPALVLALISIESGGSVVRVRPG